MGLRVNQLGFGSKPTFLISFFGLFESRSGLKRGSGFQIRPQNSDWMSEWRDGLLAHQDFHTRPDNRPIMFWLLIGLIFCQPVRVIEPITKRYRKSAYVSLDDEITTSKDV